MFKRIIEIFANRRRRRRLARIRQEFARCGYLLDHLEDSKIEAALTRGGECELKEVPLTGKTIYFALRRL